MTRKKLAKLQAEYQILRTGLDSLGQIPRWQERKFRPGDKILVTIRTQSLNEQQLVFFDNGKEMDFVVDNDTVINIPLLGHIAIGQLNRSQLTKVIKEKASYYIKDPFVLVEPVQIQVKILGQVEKPGIVSIPENDATLVSLFAQTGGISQYAKRDSVVVIRENEGVLKTYYVDVRNAQAFFSSPVYRLQQNDIIIVKPSDYLFKTYRNQEVGINIARITPISTVLGIILVAYPLFSFFNR